MKGYSARRIALIVAVAALLSGPALAQQELLGGPASPDGPVDREVRIDAKTRWVNVTQDETIRFVLSGPGGERVFAWRFETQHFAMDLGRIAPAGTIDRVIRVYVAPNMRSSCG